MRLVIENITAAQASAIFAIIGVAVAVSDDEGKRRQPTRQSRPADPATERSRKLQGQYMGLIRHASARDKARAKALVRGTGGREAAIRFLKGRG